jgi:hypothetical protein
MNAAPGSVRWSARRSTGGSSPVAIPKNKRGERRPRTARRSKNQPPNDGVRVATPSAKRSPRAIPCEPQPGRPSEQTSTSPPTRWGRTAAHAAANGPPPELPSTPTRARPSASRTTTASWSQSDTRSSDRRSLHPTPGDRARPRGRPSHVRPDPAAAPTGENRPGRGTTAPARRPAFRQPDRDHAAIRPSRAPHTPLQRRHLSSLHLTCIGETNTPQPNAPTKTAYRGAWDGNPPAAASVGA